MTANSDRQLQLVDDQIVEALFSVANQVLNLLETRISERIGSKESLCAEKAIVLSGRIASRLLQVGLTVSHLDFAHKSGLPLGR